MTAVEPRHGHVGRTEAGAATPPVPSDIAVNTALVAERQRDLAALAQQQWQVSRIRGLNRASQRLRRADHDLARAINEGLRARSELSERPSHSK